MQQHQTIFANFICKFGEKDMAEYLSEIVLPAFTDDTLIRTYGESSMRFENVHLLEIDGDPVVAGKFIYNTVLRRTHIYKQGVGQVEAPGIMESAPSAFFVLTLDNHRLIYFGETPHAPDLSRFWNTIEVFIDRKRRQYIEREYIALREEQNASGQLSGIRRPRRVTKKSLLEAHPKQKINIVPLSGDGSIREFIDRFETLKSLDITVLRRNKEVDPAETMNELDQLAQLTGAPNAKLSVTNNDGLQQAGVAKLVEQIAESGNQIVKIDGVDKDGEKLSGNNNDFSFKPTYQHVPVPTVSRAQFLLGKLKTLIALGKLKAPVGDQAVKAKALKLVGDQ